MAIEIKDYDTMVEDVLDTIIASNVGFTDKNPGSVLRTLVEAILAELDLSNYTLSYIYDNQDIDQAMGEELDRAISFLGVVRNSATSASTVIRFSRVTPAVEDIPIYNGTIISTRPDADGNVIEFSVDTDTILATGQTYVDVPVHAIVPGLISVSANVVTVMPLTVFGISSVTNQLEILGGTDEETDEQLRDRAKTTLAGLGKGTANALVNAVMDVDGVLYATVSNTVRGIGTADMSVVTSIMPAPQTVKDEISTVIADTKSAGIDILVVYPDITNVTVNITLTLDNASLLSTSKINAKNAIVAYSQTMVAGDTFVLSQMVRKILESDINILDVSVTSPGANVTVGATYIPRVNSVTINGEVVL